MLSLGGLRVFLRDLVFLWRVIYPRRWCETVKTLLRLSSLHFCTSSIQKMSVIAGLPPTF